MPGLATLLGYRRAWLTGDLLAGVTVAAYLVPQVMAYAGGGGLPPVTGLWAILPALGLYSLFGSSRLLSVGPESTPALMTATVVAPLAAEDPGRYASLAAALAVTVGLLCLAARAVRLGFLADLLSRPVLIGYVAGVALIMMVDQLPKLTGVRTSGSDFFAKLWSFLTHVTDGELATVLFFTAALVFLFVLARYARAVPGPLVAVVLGTAAGGLRPRRPVRAQGDRRDPVRSTGPHCPGPERTASLLLPAIGVLLVAYTDFIHLLDDLEA